MRKAMKKLLVTILATLALASCGSKVETNSSSTVEPQTSKEEETSLTSSESSEVKEEMSTEEVTSSSEEESSSESLPAIYKVTFQNYDGTFLYETEVEEGQSAEYVGETPTKPAEENADYTYEFIGWDKNIDEVFEDTLTTAMFEPKSNEGWGGIIWF